MKRHLRSFAALARLWISELQIAILETAFTFDWLYWQILTPLVIQ